MSPLAILLQDYNIILGSQSPRRRQLLEGLDISFEVVVKQTDESFPESLEVIQVAEYVAKNKFFALQNEISDKNFLITADTIVILENRIIQKPQNLIEAKEMLEQLSGKTHIVTTGVCLGTNRNHISFSEQTQVTFSKINSLEIDYYINQYKPLDKAGAYGVQEWIGYIGIDFINGSYYNVMGLPVQTLYKKINEFFN